MSGWKRRRGMEGFTLIELMIALTILTILAVVAYPGYQTIIQKTRRADAHAALTDYATAMERYYYANGTYSTAVAGTVYGSTSSDGYYTLSISSQTSSAYGLTATATGAQASDTDCAALTLDSLGSKTPTDCW